MNEKIHRISFPLEPNDDLKPDSERVIVLVDMPHPHDIRGLWFSAGNVGMPVVLTLPCVPHAVYNVENASSENLEIILQGLNDRVLNEPSKPVKKPKDTHSWYKFNDRKYGR